MVSDRELFELRGGRVIMDEDLSEKMYIIDGRLLQLPTAKKMVQYKEPHWLPITFSKRGVTE